MTLKTTQVVIAVIDTNNNSATQQLRRITWHSQIDMCGVLTMSLWPGLYKACKNPR